MTNWRSMMTAKSFIARSWWPWHLKVRWGDPGFADEILFPIWSQIVITPDDLVARASAAALEGRQSPGITRAHGKPITP
jgi:hypothetical protein